MIQSPDDLVVVDPCCPPKVPVEDRALLALEEADRLEAIFKVLANGTRLRLIHALVRQPDLCVTSLAATIGMRPQAVSNQLQRLVDRGILAPRRNGNQVHYRIVDPCVVALLDRGLCLSEDAARVNS
jgi:DNA-binding transcriptional ArsR family regulator